MAQSIILSSAQVQVYLNGKPYNELQSISYSTDYGEDATYGIDSLYAQEISSSRITVSGSMTGVVLSGDYGTQGKSITPLIDEVLQSPYVSIRIFDRKTQQNIMFIPQCKITKESFSTNIKGRASTNLSFKGIIPYSGYDLA